MTKSPALENLTFEEALAELEKIVRSLESGAGDLKGSIDAYARGAALKKLCESRLKDAQMRIEKISVGADGQVKTVPFEGE